MITWQKRGDTYYGTGQCEWRLFRQYNDRWVLWRAATATGMPSTTDLADIYKYIDNGYLKVVELCGTAGGIT